MDNTSIATFRSEFKYYEHIIFKASLFVLNTKETLNSSISIVEKYALSNAIKAVFSTN